MCSIFVLLEILHIWTASSNNTASTYFQWTSRAKLPKCIIHLIISILLTLKILRHLTFGLPKNKQS